MKISIPGNDSILQFEPLFKAETPSIEGKGGTLKVQIVTPFLMQWVAGFKKYFESLGWDVDIHDKPRLIPKPSAQLLMWLNEDTVEYINSGYKNGTKSIVFIRRYEYYTDAIEKTNWENVDAVVMVNYHLAQGFKERTGIKPYYIPNGIDPDMWTHKKHDHGKKIAWVGFVNQRKNLPLALQILSKMPRDYELHVAGGFQDGATIDYVSNFAGRNGLTDHVFMYGHVGDIDLWLEDKNYLLCTAISEGCPNNVIEAMAKGIKPVVHNWPGSESLFRGYVFNTVDEAVDMMSPQSPYRSGAYHNFADVIYGKNIYNNVVQLVQEVTGGKPKTFHDLDWNVTIRSSKPDVYVVSYPKCGRTWLRLFFQLTIAKILDENFPIEANRIYPDESLHPSIEFTHSHINWDPDKKTVFLIRNPKDILVSSYFHCQRRSKTVPMDMSLSEFIRSPGGGIDFIIEWRQKWERRFENCEQKPFLIEYESMHERPEETFSNLLNFIGITDFNQEDLDICIQASQFDEVKRNIKNGKLASFFNNSSSEMNRYQRLFKKDPESAKLRQGKVGGYKNYLSEEDIKYIDYKLEN